MSDSKQARAQHLIPLEKEELMTSGTRYPVKGSGFQQISGFGSVEGCLGHGFVSLVLQLLSFILFTGLLVAILVQGQDSNVPSSQRQEESKIYQELTQLKAQVDCLCHPCSWDWTFFQGNCYFFSMAKQNWTNSVISCQEVGAQLMVIKSEEEQNFLQMTSEKNGETWMGLSDLSQESMWKWVDGSLLSLGFMRYWQLGEPNNYQEEDCAEFCDDGWNDSRCELETFWICKKSTASCSNK